MTELSVLGFGPFFDEQVASVAADPATVVRIAAEHRGGFEVWGVAGQGPARLVGRLRRELRGADRPAVGDWVLVSEPPEPEEPTSIIRVLRRKSAFVRAAAGRRSGEQVVAANVDRVFAVAGLDADFNLRRLERYVARIWASGAVPEIVLSKADLRPDAADYVAELEERLVSVPVHTTSSVAGLGVDVVRERIPAGMTAAFVGSSGAGKSTLINALLGEERLATGAVRARDGRGCHVTTHRQLVLLPEGGLVVDTPGMRELALVDEGGLDEVFDDIPELGKQCRFRDCRHESEPGCAVRRAIEEGRLAHEQLDHYGKLVREARAFETRNDARKRRQEARRWSQLSDEVARLRKWKGGKS